MMKDPYVYSGTEVLKNLAGIKEENAFACMEAEYTSLRIADLSIDNTLSYSDFNDLCMTHYAIFQDVFQWAGRVRIINIEKAEISLGGLSIEYSDCFDIERDAAKIIDEMKSVKWEEKGLSDVCKLYSRYMADLWKVHPFREGNTRTVVIFCSHFIESKGWYLESELFKDNAAYMRTSLVAASAIFHDLGNKRKPEYLERIVFDALEQGAKMKDRIITELQKANLPCEAVTIREVVKWNRIEHKEHTSEEIKNFFMD